MSKSSTLKCAECQRAHVTRHTSHVTRHLLRCSSTCDCALQLHCRRKQLISQTNCKGGQVGDCGGGGDGDCDGGGDDGGDGTERKNCGMQMAIEVSSAWTEFQIVATSRRLWKLSLYHSLLRLRFDRHYVHRTQHAKKNLMPIDLDRKH